MHILSSLVLSNPAAFNVSNKVPCYLPLLLCLCVGSQCKTFSAGRSGCLTQCRTKLILLAATVPPTLERSPYRSVYIYMLPSLEVECCSEHACVASIERPFQCWFRVHASQPVELFHIYKYIKYTHCTLRMNTNIATLSCWMPQYSKVSEQRLPSMYPKSGLCREVVFAQRYIWLCQIRKCFWWEAFVQRLVFARGSLFAGCTVLLSRLRI